jgi:hypothetical protein
MESVTTVSLADFLTARIAEDEAGYRRMAETLSVAKQTMSGPVGARPTVVHETILSRSRLLAECEAKRRIVEAFKDAERAVAGYDDNNPNNPPSYWQEWGNRHALELALEVLAQPYADHPDFNPDWR